MVISEYPFGVAREEEESSGGGGGEGKMNGQVDERTKKEDPKIHGVLSTPLLLLLVFPPPSM